MSSTPTISGSGPASGRSGTSRWASSRRSPSTTSAWAWTSTPTSAAAPTTAAVRGVVPQPYLASYLYYRPQLPANVALHLYPVRGLRLELLAQWGTDGVINSLGGRPALIYDLGWIKFRVAGEYQWLFPADPAPAAHNEYKNRGVAGSIQFVFAPWVEFGPELRPRGHRLLQRGLAPDGSGVGRHQQVGRHRELRRLPQLPSLRRHADRRRVNFASFTNLHLNTDTGENDRRRTRRTSWRFSTSSTTSCS